MGYPQLSAVIECADAAHGLKGHIISDGGCTCPGDFSKAFGAGADFVMAGGMFAGHLESAGELCDAAGSPVAPEDAAAVEAAGGGLYKDFYGMSSAVTAAALRGSPPVQCSPAVPHVAALCLPDPCACSLGC